MKIVSHFVMVVLIGCVLVSHEGVALTFKKDGSVVQKSGKVEAETFSTRFASELKNPTKDWSKSSGRPKPVAGFFGDDILIPGAPLLRIQGIQKGEDYLQAIQRLNGFVDQKSVYRYIIANSTPEFLEEMGLNEAQAHSYLDTAVKEMLAGANIKNASLANSLQAAQAAFASQGSEIETTIAEQITETIETQMEGAVSDAVEEAVETAVKSSLERLQELYPNDVITQLDDGSFFIQCNSDC